MNRRWFGAALVMVTAAGVLHGEVTLAPVFADHMLLQRDAQVKVWGKADAGSRVAVTFAGEQQNANVGDDGRWSVNFAAKPAGGPHEITVVKSGVGEEERLSVNNVLMGDLWICSGQSNMAWSVRNSANPQEEIAAANHPNIRLMMVQNTTAAEPQETARITWNVTSPETIAGFSAVGYYFGREINQQTGVPVGLIHTNWGGTPAEAWTPMATLEANADFAPIIERGRKYPENYPAMLQRWEEAMEKWQTAKAEAEAAGQPVPQQPRKPAEPDKNPWIPATLYNGMIHPLLGLNVKGALWYQGESNAGRAAQYETLLPAMIRSWRDAFGADFPFYIVQLSAFGKDTGTLGNCAWAELREAQANTARDLPKSGLAVTIDIGNPDDIHPKNKQDVGKRLALVALKQTYGVDVPFSGPVLKDVRFSDGKATIALDHAEGLNVKGETLEGFMIAGEDQKFVPAQAKLDGDKVVVWAEEVAQPASVRYGWMNSPVCNLYNAAGLPAVPFRTDDWPRVTANNR